MSCGLRPDFGQLGRKWQGDRSAARRDRYPFVHVQTASRDRESQSARILPRWPRYEHCRTADTLWANWRHARQLLADRNIPFLAVLQPTLGAGHPDYLPDR
jgi:hypothetical protein